jgi:hypothetical protein
MQSSAAWARRDVFSARVNSGDSENAALKSLKKEIEIHQMLGRGTEHARSNARKFFFKMKKNFHPRNFSLLHATNCMCMVTERQEHP